MILEVLFKRAKSTLGVVARRDSHADAGPRPWHDRVSRARHSRSIYSQDGDGRPRPKPLGEGTLTDELDAGPQSYALPQLGLFYIHSRRRFSMQATNCDITCRVMQCGDYSAQYGERVWYRPAIFAAMYAVVKRAHFDYAIHDTAQRFG